MKKSLLILIASAGFAANSFAATACANPVAELDTNFGKIDIQLNPAKAPISVANFEQYVKAGFYSNKIFHRVIPGFMIQGGGFDKDMKEATTKAPIANEATNGLHNDKYTIAMARTNQPHSATAQFFINIKDNDFLNFSGENMHGWGYAVFGKAIAGTEVIDKIKAVKTGRHGHHDDVPTETVVIESAEILA